MTATVGKPGRNPTVDILRGIAMLMVVLGHTMSECTVGAEVTFLYNIIWTLQMPLFMLISGYVTKFSRPLTSARDWGLFVGKRTLTYLLPWAAWTFGVRGLIFGQTGLLNLTFLLYHMDVGYWFLFSIWTITMLWGVAQVLSERLCRSKGKYIKTAVLTGFYVLGMGILAAIGLLMGLSFLCIKLTLYYMPFYFLGFLFGRLEGDLAAHRRGALIKDATVAACFVGWIVLLIRFNFFSIGDGLVGILLRASASLMGCVAVCGLVSQLTANAAQTRACRFINRVGVHSLEIYLLHYLLLALISPDVPPACASPAGVLLFLLNFAVTVGSTYGIICLIGQNRILSTVLFGKTTKSKGA